MFNLLAQSKSRVQIKIAYDYIPILTSIFFTIFTDIYNICKFIILFYWCFKFYFLINFYIFGILFLGFFAIHFQASELNVCITYFYSNLFTKINELLCFLCVPLWSRNLTFTYSILIVNDPKTVYKSCFIPKTWNSRPLEFYF